MGPDPISVSTFGFSVLGTTLAISSANTLNQIREIEYDAMMSRTFNRPLPSGMSLILLFHSIEF